MARPKLLIDELENQPGRNAKVTRPHVAQEYRDRGLPEDAEDLVRHLLPWAQDNALGRKVFRGGSTTMPRYVKLCWHKINRHRWLDLELRTRRGFCRVTITTDYYQGVRRNA